MTVATERRHPCSHDGSAVRARRRAAADRRPPRGLSLHPAGPPGDAGRHRLSDLLHDRAELLQNASEPSDEGQGVCRCRQLRRHPEKLLVPPGHTPDAYLDRILHRLRLFARACRRAGAASRIRRPRRAARRAADPLRRQRGRRLLCLEMALPFRFRRDRRADHAARADGRADQFPRQHHDRRCHR